MEEIIKIKLVWELGGLIMFLGTLLAIILCVCIWVTSLWVREKFLGWEWVESYTIGDPTKDLVSKQDRRHSKYVKK